MHPSSIGFHPTAATTTSLDFEYAGLFTHDWPYQLQSVQQPPMQHQQAHYGGGGTSGESEYQPTHHQQSHYGMTNSTGVPMCAYTDSQYGPPLPSSGVGFMSSSAADNFAVTTAMEPEHFMPMADPTGSLNFGLSEYQNDMALSMPTALNNTALQQMLTQNQREPPPAALSGSSPAGTVCDVQSLSDYEWSMVDHANPHRNSFESWGTVSNPSQNLHIRSKSDSSTSDDPHSAGLSGSFEEVHWPLQSSHDFHGSEFLDAQYIQQQAHGLPITSSQQPSPSSLAVSPADAGVSGSSSNSPTSSGPTSPPVRRRKSPVEVKTTKAVIKKTPNSRKDALMEKKIGRRRGPLRPDQRQQAHEIRKLRACLRCKFLKKTCDKGEPCGGCRPSHARLWQVPCTRMDIKDIAYFMKDWNADYERHVSLGFSVGNIKGFSTSERLLYVTHGYGHYLPINAREVFVRDDKCFDVDWVEADNPPREFDINTAKLSAGMEGVSTTLLSEYLDRHLDISFEGFVDDYFEGTRFMTEILKTAHRYYMRERTPAIRKGLKLVLAYNLTLHVTMVEGLTEEEQFKGKINNTRSRFDGKTMAPVMINFQVKCALAGMWRELQKDILEELSALYSSVYSGEKLKNWPTIFMLAAILLAIWEWMQFDCYYRVPDESYVNKFCDDMETTPVGVIVGLFQAISTKLPGLQEWDTGKHHHLLGSNQAVCDALTEVKGHIDTHGGSARTSQLPRVSRLTCDRALSS